MRRWPRKPASFGLPASELMADPFATPTELASYLQTATQGEADAGNPNVLDTAVAVLALESASAAIRSVCGWVISEETVTASLPWSGRFFLPTLNLTALSVAMAGNPLVVGAVSWSASGLVQVAAPYTSQLLAVTYTHGFNPVPDAVRDVCLERAGRAYHNPTGMPAVTYGNVTESYFKAGDVSLADDYRLSPFKLPAIA